MMAWTGLPALCLALLWFDLSSAQGTFNILLEDDNACSRTVSVEQIYSLGLIQGRPPAVVQADSRASALAKLKASPGKFQMIISDWSMGAAGSGLDLSKDVRGDPALKNIPLILMSVEARSQMLVQAVLAGASAYVVKPFNTPTIRNKIIKALEEGK